MVRFSQLTVSLLAQWSSEVFVDHHHEGRCWDTVQYCLSHPTSASHGNCWQKKNEARLLKNLAQFTPADQGATSKPRFTWTLAVKLGMRTEMKFIQHANSTNHQLIIDFYTCYFRHDCLYDIRHRATRIQHCISYPRQYHISTGTSRNFIRQ